MATSLAAQTRIKKRAAQPVRAYWTSRGKVPSHNATDFDILLVYGLAHVWQPQGTWSRVPRYTLIPQLSQGQAGCNDPTLKIISRGFLFRDSTSTPKGNKILRA